MANNLEQPAVDRDVIVPAFPGTLLLSRWIVTKAILGKTGTNHIPAFATWISMKNSVSCCK